MERLPDAAVPPLNQDEQFKIAVNLAKAAGENARLKDLIVKLGARVDQNHEYHYDGCNATPGVHCYVVQGVRRTGRRTRGSDDADPCATQ